MSSDADARRTRIVNLVAVVVPFAAFLVAVGLAWGSVVGWLDIAVLAGMYLAANFLGIDIGFHRLITHRSFKTYPAVRNGLAVLGTMAVQGPVVSWVADHRQHHAFADHEGDPHSPHAGYGEGWRAALRGLAHAHVGWLLDGKHRSEPMRWARDVLRERAMRRISASFLPIAAAGLAIPFAIGLAAGGTLEAALTAFLWGGPVRIFLGHHASWSINSICHYYGHRRFPTDDESRNSRLLALPSLGAAWHHNHHAFPRSASHGLRPAEIDVAGLAIRAMGRLGLAWDVVRISPEQQRRREAASGVRASSGARA